MNEENASCLFCGTKEAKVVEKEYLVSYRVECFCGVSGPFADSEEEAERYWSLLGNQSTK